MSDPTPYQQNHEVGPQFPRLRSPSLTEQLTSTFAPRFDPPSVADQVNMLRRGLTHVMLTVAASVTFTVNGPVQAWMYQKLSHHIRFLSGFAVLALLTLLAGCGAGYLDDPADTQQNYCDSGDPIKIDRPGHVGEVLKIRLSNAGAFVDRCELTDVLYEINWDYPQEEGKRKPKPKPNAPRLPKFVVLYIHGWKHSASERDSDLRRFTRLVDQLAVANKGKKQVLGIYVGWNATSRIPPFNWSPFDNMTFWSKQTIADRIAQTGVITRILSSVGSLMSYGASARGDSAANQFIAIGHSFGARMLFSATNQALIYETAKAHPGYSGGKYQTVKGVANAVILLNPAFEAARYTTLAAITRTEEEFSDAQLPLLLSVSSEGDWATKVAFPVGQWLGSYRSDAELVTLGNYTEYQTHSLRAADSNACGSSDSNSLSENFVANELCLARDQPPHNKDQIFQPRNPFLIARTSTDIIKDHNDVWNERFSQWLFAYVNELGNQHRHRLLDK